MASQRPANPVAEGRSKLTLNRGLYGKLRSEGIRLVRLGAGRATGRAVTLPAGAGDVSPRELSATVRLRGGFALRGETYFLFSVQPTTASADASAGIVEGAESDGVSMEIFGPPPRYMLLRHPRIDLASGELAAKLSALSTEGPVTAPLATLDYGAAKTAIRPAAGALESSGIRAIANQLVAAQLNERFATPGMFGAGETLARMTVTLHTR